ncbi:MAG: hypothetical protein QOI31_1154 [Solirubrobacterales bacterium]|jgi:hypothetical protein|nr:hypothetical protein [Solirubrobacterales bacterium]
MHWPERLRACADRRGNLLGALALFIALGSSAYAAVEIPRNSVGSREVVNDSLRGDDIRESSLDCTAIVGCGTGGFTMTSQQNTGNPGYYAPLGEATRFSDEADAQVLVPTAGVASGLVAQITVPAASDLTFAVRKNGNPTNLTCTIPSNATLCSNLASTATFALGDLVSIEGSAVFGVPGPIRVSFGFR